MSKPAPFSDRLLAWWEINGRHDLPWQHPRTPYRVWVSEIMLQQTQVATVIPYFEAWIARLPDLASLASAELDDVLALWSGLGYYARARNMHKAALACMEQHGGKLPDSPELLSALPGIGESTANAIISQAHDRPLAILDGNAKRVLARHATIEGWPGKSKFLKQFWSEAEKRLPPDRGADYTQAIMDLGATVCTRTRPTCMSCPVAIDCRALSAGAIDRYPAKKPAIKIREQSLYLAVIKREDGAILMERRPPAGIWGGLWSLPEAPSRLDIAQRFGLEESQMQDLAQVEHRLTHRLLKLKPIACGQPLERSLAEDHLEWCTPSELTGLGMPRPVSKLLQAFTAQKD